MKLTSIVYTGLLALLALPSARADCPLEIQTPFLVVALSKSGFMGTMENANRLNELCPSDERDCVANALATKTDDIPVHDTPSGNVVATLRVVYTPGKPISADLVQDGKSVSFTPVIYDSDWGYGPPWFHATLVDSRQGWKRIVLPLVGGGWVDLPEAQVLSLVDLPAAKVLKLAEKGRVYPTKDTIVRFPAGGEVEHRQRHVVVLTSTPNSVTVRDEQPADSPYAVNEDDEDAPPPLAPFTEQVIPLAELYDDTCNVLLSPAYTRGC